MKIDVSLFCNIIEQKPKEPLYSPKISINWGNLYYSSDLIEKIHICSEIFKFFCKEN